MYEHVLVDNCLLTTCPWQAHRDAPRKLVQISILGHIGFAAKGLSVIFNKPWGSLICGKLHVAQPIALP